MAEPYRDGRFFGEAFAPIFPVCSRHSGVLSVCSTSRHDAGNRHLPSATAERPFATAGPMVRIRFPPAGQRGVGCELDFLNHGRRREEARCIGQRRRISLRAREQTKNPHDSVANGQIIIALVVTPEGLPLAYEVLPGNTSDKTTLRAFLDASSGNTARRAGSG